ncbi:MAG: TrkH family potassium uptake protein, partial [Synergistes sp.]|nr:TrkH family potassium uptake protein [Synergistes sp.]
MNFRIVARFLSMLVLMVSASMAFPLFWALHGGLHDVKAFLLSMLIGFAAAAVLFLLSGKISSEEPGEREAVAGVAFSWIVASLVGCLPYILSGEIPSFTDAYFEAMSGFTTTGSSILGDVEKLPRGIVMWRAQTQWLGGMGIIVLLIAMLPFFNANLTQFFKAESPGPSLDKTTPRITEMAKNLWFVYMQLTLIGVILLCIGEVKFYDAIAYVFAAVATGGFSAHNNGVAFYNSAYVEYVLAIIMFIAGTNFNLHLAAIKTASMNPYKDSEFRFYSGIVGISIFLICLNLMLNGTYTNISDAFRYASFQVVSIITTTGFASTDYGEWSVFAQLLLLLLMFVGGCAGSTSGAIKCVRFQIVL